MLVNTDMLLSTLLFILAEAPSGGPACSVQTVNGALLQFLCLWPGGAPEAQVSFPSLSLNASGYSNYSITINDTQRLHGQEIICKADHPLNQTQCSVIPRKSSSVSHLHIKYLVVQINSTGNFLVFLEVIVW